jgi:hypothetical protein
MSARKLALVLAGNVTVWAGGWIGGHFSSPVGQVGSMVLFEIGVLTVLLTVLSNLAAAKEGQSS